MILFNIKDYTRVKCFDYLVRSSSNKESVYYYVNCVYSDNKKIKIELVNIRKPLQKINPSVGYFLENFDFLSTEFIPKPLLNNVVLNIYGNVAVGIPITNKLGFIVLCKYLNYVVSTSSYQLKFETWRKEPKPDYYTKNPCFETKIDDKKSVFSAGSLIDLDERKNIEQSVGGGSDFFKHSVGTIFLNGTSNKYIVYDGVNNGALCWKETPEPIKVLKRNKNRKKKLLNYKHIEPIILK